MILLSIVAVLVVLPSANAHAQAKPPATKGAFSVKFIGESGGYSHPTAEASNSMEAGTWQQSGSGGSIGSAGGAPAPQEHPEPQPRPSGSGQTGPVMALPASQVLPARPRPGASELRGAARDEPIRTESDRRRYSLWDGLAAPLELPTYKVKDVSPDQALALGRRDYDSHILSQRDAVLLNAAGLTASGGTDTPAPGPEVFVTFNLDLKKNPAASLKDAVAGLAAAAGFRQDKRFEPAAIGPGPDQVALWGWMPPGRVGEAMKVPAVARLEINPAARRAVQAQTLTDVLIGVRVPDATAAARVLTRLEQDLGTPGLRVKRGIGTQTAPGTGETVLVVEADVPIVALARLMAHRDVVKVVPAPQSCAAGDGRYSRAKVNRFFSYVLAQSPLLLVLTLLMLLPTIGNGLVSAASVFIPYR